MVTKLALGALGPFRVRIYTDPWEISDQADCLHSTYGRCINGVMIENVLIMPVQLNGYMVCTLCGKLRWLKYVKGPDYQGLKLESPEQVLRVWMTVYFNFNPK